MWIVLISISALTLGIYDVAKKRAVNDNAVMAVLLMSTATGTVLVILFQAATGALFTAVQITPRVYLLLLLKSAVVSASWICAYYAMRALPITIMAPIRGSQPLWTVIGALIVFGEFPAPFQWAGIAVIIIGYFLFSVIGKREGIRFHANAGILLVFLATILGAASGLYDKYLLQPCGLSPNTVQFWFQINLMLIIGTVFLIQRGADLGRTPFTWRWTIPLVGVLLVISDWFYFTALHEPGVLISVLSPMRRINAVISFIIGGLVFREVHKREKAFSLAIIVIGVIMLYWSSAVHR